MPLAIASTVAVPLTTSSTSVGAAALNQTRASAAGSAITSVEAAPAPADNPKLAEALKALGKSAHLQSDLQDVASALVQSMQRVIQDRPDLAMASFDFQSDQGSIKVVSSSLNTHDKVWLEQTLNANQALVKAVQSFHDDATDSYALWSDASGQPLSASDAAKVSSLADTSYHFMSMFRTASQAMVKTMDPNASYTTSNGAPIDFHQNVNSALSFLVFQKSNQAITDGTNTYASNTGRVYHGMMRGNLFSMTNAVRSLMPNLSPGSIGLKATA